jgi:hypothetical protein
VPITIGELQGAIKAEYGSLVSLFGLSSLPLDVYEVDDSGNGGLTAYGTDKRNDTPGYTPTYIVLPQSSGDLSAWHPTQPVIPPPTWDRHTDDWPAWRTDLWHEMVHQYQHQVLKNWDPKDGGGGHTRGWPEAVREVAAAFGLTPGQLLGVL